MFPMRDRKARTEYRSRIRAPFQLSTCYKVCNIVLAEPLYAIIVFSSYRIYQMRTEGILSGSHQFIDFNCTSIAHIFVYTSYLCYNQSFLRIRTIYLNPITSDIFQKPNKINFATFTALS